MPEPSSPSFEQFLESDIQRLAAEVMKHKEHPETKTLGDQEILKRSIQSVTQTAPPPPPGDASGSPLPAYVQGASSETKLEIEYLLDLALREGIFKANREAKKSNAFVLDAFHDALVGKLYPEFRKRGILE